jgi:hypothetical protein
VKNKNKGSSMKVDINDAKNTLSLLIEKVALGEEVIITKDDADYQIIQKTVNKKFSSFPFGCIKGIVIKDNFDDPLPDEIAQSFGIENSSK